MRKEPDLTGATGRQAIEINQGTEVKEDRRELES